MRIPSGSTDRYVYFVAVDSTDFTTRETGLSSFTVYRSRNGAAAAAMTTPTINETDATNMPGVYELLLDEDTTLTAGNDTEEICFHITQASMAPVTRVVEIYRPETTEGNTLDVTSGGAAGIDWGNVENKTTTHDFSNTTIGVTTLNSDMITTAEVNAEVDTALADIGLDHLLAASVTGTDVTDNSIVAKLVSSSATADWDDYDNTTDALMAIRDRGDAAWTTGGAGSDRLLMVDTTIATLSSQTSFTLDAGSADDDAYNGCTIVIEDVSTSTQKAVGIVDDYTGSTKTVTLLEDPGVFTMAATDKVYILAEKSLKPTTAADYHIDVTSGGAVGIDWGNVENPTTAVDLSATDIQLCDTVTTLTNLPAITSNWLTAAGIAASALDGKGDWNTTTPPTAAAIADQVWDEATAGHTTAGSYGKAVGDGVTDWVTATGFSTHSAADVWTNGTRTLTAFAFDVDLNADQSGVTIGTVNAMAGTITTLDALDTAQDSQHATTQSAISTAQTDLDTITGSDGVTLATTQGNYAPAKTSDVASEISDALTVDTLVDGKTIVASMQIIGAVVAGKVSGASTSTEVFVGLDGATTRATVTADTDGNRTAVVYG